MIKSEKTNTYYKSNVTKYYFANSKRCVNHYNANLTATFKILKYLD